MANKYDMTPYSKNAKELIAVLTSGITFPDSYFDELDLMHSQAVLIITKRVDAFKLKISFDKAALLLMTSLIDRAGAAVVALIDCLDYLAEQNKSIIVAKDLVAMYPKGFYSELGLDQRVTFIKENSSPFHYLY